MLHTPSSISSVVLTVSVMGWLTVVFWLAVLLPGVGSGTVDVTVAVFVNSPPNVSLTITTTLID